MIEVKSLVELLNANKMKNVSVYDLSESGEEKFVVLSTSNKVQDSKKVADIIVSDFLAVLHLV